MGPEERRGPSCHAPFAMAGSRAPPEDALRCCSSSVVEHSLGKGEVESSILSCSTIFSPANRQALINDAHASQIEARPLRKNQSFALFYHIAVRPDLYLYAGRPYAGARLRARSAGPLLLKTTVEGSTPNSLLRARAAYRRGQVASPNEKTNWRRRRPGKWGELERMIL